MVPDSLRGTDKRRNGPEFSNDIKKRKVDDKAAEVTVDLLFSEHLLCLWVCVSRQTLCRGHRCGCCSVAGRGGADGCLPVSDRSILPGQGHSTGWDQLLAHCAKDGFAG